MLYMDGAGGHQWSEEDSSHPSFSLGSRSVLPSFLPPSHFSSHFSFHSFGYSTSYSTSYSSGYSSGYSQWVPSPRRFPTRGAKST